jgi:hypothetical protein
MDAIQNEMTAMLVGADRGVFKNKLTGRMNTYFHTDSNFHIFSRVFIDLATENSTIPIL